MSDKQLKTCMNIVLKTYLKNSLNLSMSLALCLTFMSMPAVSRAFEVDRAVDSLSFAADAAPRFETTQSNGMTLPQAVDSVRRGGNVKQVLSASTRVSNGREVHHIKVLTKDGKVRTHTRQGRKRN